MAVPSFEEFMRPVLECVSKNNEINRVDILNAVAEQLRLSESDVKEMLPSGNRTRYEDRVSWALTYLRQSGLIESPRKSHFTITERGKLVLTDKQAKLDTKFLEQFDEYKSFKSRKRKKKDSEKEIVSEQNNTTTPSEDLLKLHEQIDAKLVEDLLDRVIDNEPSFLEELIVKLLKAMGYGGETEDAGEVLGKSGDNGVDGVINQDKLGVEQIYMQAKRYAHANNVGASDIRDFYGALKLKKCEKGIFFTTSSFSPAAKDTAESYGTIVLIDGQQLANLMIEHNVGCTIEDTLLIKKVDENFFPD